VAAAAAEAEAEAAKQRTQSADNTVAGDSVIYLRDVQGSGYDVLTEASASTTADERSGDFAVDEDGASLGSNTIHDDEAADHDAADHDAADHGGEPPEGSVPASVWMWCLLSGIVVGFFGYTLTYWITGLARARVKINKLMSWGYKESPTLQTWWQMDAKHTGGKGRACRLEPLLEGEESLAQPNDGARIESDVVPEPLEPLPDRQIPMSPRQPLATSSPRQKELSPLKTTGISPRRGQDHWKVRPSSITTSNGIGSEYSPGGMSIDC